MNDEQVSPHTVWRTRPMTEQCETTDFFEAGKVYREQALPQLAADLRPQFWCQATWVHPSTNVVYATGVYRSAVHRPWNPYPVQLLLTNWKQGWDEIELPKEES